MRDQAIQLMQELGFSGYEAKAYVGILEGQPVGAYELAKRCNVPSSKIYETVNKLLNKEVIQFASDQIADNPSYVALPPEDLVSRMNQEVSHKTTSLLPLLTNLSDDKTPDFIWPISSLEQLKEKAIGSVQSAQKSILLSCWPQELSWIESALRHASSMSKDIALVHFGNPDCNIGATYHHPVEKTLYAEKGARGFTLVVDSNEVVIANLNDEPTIDACWSKNRAFVTVAEDYVKHDVYITKVTRHLKNEMVGRYGQQYEKLRNIFEPEA